MNTKSVSVSTISALQQQLDSTITSEFTPTLAIVYCCVNFDFEQICHVFIEHGIDVIGCSTAGEIVDDNLSVKSIVAMFLDIKREQYTINYTTYEPDDYYVRSFGIGRIALSRFDHPALMLLSGGIAADGAKVVAGIKDGIGKEIPLYGGLAGDCLGMSNTYAFANGFVTDNGLVALILDTDKIEVNGMATSGWQPMGLAKTITKSDGNIIYTINNEPALDVFLHHFGFDETPTTHNSQLLSIQTNYPFQIMRNDGSTILRSPWVLDEEKRTVGMAGSVEEGDQFRFSNAPGFEVIEETVREFGALKQKAPEADALFLFSCIGRHGAFGPVLEEEIAGLYDYWNKPLVGFLTYGEIGNTKNGTCEFHNETCSLMLLKEK